MGLNLGTDVIKKEDNTKRRKFCYKHVLVAMSTYRTLESLFNTLSVTIWNGAKSRCCEMI